VKKKEKKAIQIDKETVKISLFADNIILYLKDLKLYPKTPRHHKQLQQSARIQNQLTKAISFSSTDNEQIEKEYMEIIPFTIVSKKIKYLGMNLIKDVNDIYKENYKLLKKKTEEDHRRWRDPLCS
jgi:hypothetical protein